MTNFQFIKTNFEGVFLINNFEVIDDRGYLLKDFDQNIFNQNGLDIFFDETFESFSFQNVIRGLHFQVNKPQAKLVRVLTGEILDVIVDLRNESITFGKWEGFKISSLNKNSLFIPKGFAHGFCVLSECAIVSYKCVGKYDKDSDSGIVWNDEDLNIYWSINNPVVSERDKKLGTFKEFIENIKYLEE